ncbi:hypothetical protein CMI37_15055 [Candidatus Pacearchaeota archaeon]|nr:hypothetical protein [Candidatus Pacearchaeota archaeon]
MNFKINQVFSELVVDLHPKYPIKGHADLVLKVDVDGEEKILLIDIKTINAFSYSKKFGRKPDANAQEHHKFQVGTYAMGVESMFGRCDGIFILYYKKDNSFLKLEEVDSSYIDKARGYWDKVLLEEKDGLPRIKEGYSPVYAWECKYCAFEEQCIEDNKKGK